MSTSTLASPTKQNAPGKELARPRSGSTPVPAPARSPREELRGQPGNHSRAGPTPARTEVRKEESAARAPEGRRAEKAGAAPAGAGRDGAGRGAEGRAPGKGPALEGAAPRVEAPGKAEGAARGKSVDAYLAAFEALPSRMASAWRAVGARASSLLAQEQKTRDAELPDFTAKLTGKGAKAAETVTPGKPAPKAKQVELPRGPRLSPLPTPAPTRPPPVTGNTSATQGWGKDVGQDAQALKQGGQRLLENLETEASVETSPGEPPGVPLTEGADPLRATEAEQQGNEAAEKARRDASLALLQGPGPAQVQPAEMEESPRVPPSAPGELPELEPLPGMDKVASWKLDAEAAAAFDSQAQPRMAEHLAQARARLDDAERQREAGRQAAVAETRQKVDAANAEAEDKQARAVGETRDSIASEQQAVLRQQKEAVDGLSRESSTQRKESVAEIDTRVKSDEEQIASDYQQAEKAAKEEQGKGEAKARQEKEKAERKAREDKSWWERAVELVKAAIDAVAKAIDGILSDLKKAVGGILDAVKKATLARIEKARQWINDKLDKFGTWLKKAVSAVLEEVFPELARKINAFIDRSIANAKKAVNAIAEGLKKKVSTLVDGLSKTLGKILDGFRMAVKAGAALARAVVSGDWSAAGQMFLDGILRMLGIDPAEFYAFIGKIRSSLHLIVDRPGVFVGNLVKAVKQGFGQFMDHILEHLKTGVLQWLFGTVVEMGIQMPAKFDLAGLFDVVMQVLGMTLSRLRTRAVKLIGEKNVERIEFVWNFLTETVAGGLGGLWEKASEFLGNLWDMVVGGARDWLVTTLVKKAIVKLASLFNPVGAIIQLILTAWDVFLWLRDNAQRIAELIQVVKDSMMEIATGAVGKAAHWIEKALAKTVPVAIHLLANIIGLGGLGTKIKELISKAQQAIGDAIDKVIQKVLKFFRGATGKGKDTAEKKPGGEHKDRHAEIGREVATKLSQKPGKDLSNDELLETKKKEAAELEKTYNRQLEKPVRLKISFPPAKAEQGPELPFHIHIGPNDFDMKGAIESTGEKPDVGLYGPMDTKEGRERHHVPPKGLLGWMVQQAKEAYDKIPTAEQAAAAYEWLRALRNVPGETYAPGDCLAAISIDKHTHIKKFSEGTNVWRVHYGSETAQEVMNRLKGKKLVITGDDGETYELPFTLIYRKKKSELTDEEDLKTIAEMEEEAGAPLESGETEHTPAAVGMLSTQFFKTELTAALRALSQEVNVGFREELGSVARGAAAQAREAVTIALEHSDRDGSKVERQKALEELKKLSKDSWEKVAGVKALKIL